MRAEDFHKHPLRLEEWLLNVSSYRIGDRYLAEVEAVDSGVTIARATAEAREKAEEMVIEKAAERLARTRRFDLDLTVGG
jgi:hypothetical protein